MSHERNIENWWDTPAADQANRLIDLGRGDAMGCVVPPPKGHEVDEGITWVNFSGVVIEGVAEAIIPVETQKLLDAGIDPNDGDPLTYGMVFFWADVAIEVERVEDVAPTDFKSVPKFTAEDIGHWDGASTIE